MKKKVIRLTESDVERLVKKILKEEKLNELDIESFNRNDLVPAKANIKGVDKLVIVNKRNKNVEATGPNMKGLSKEKICTIAERLIEELFVDPKKMNEISSGEIKNFEIINFC